MLRLIKRRVRFQLLLTVCLGGLIGFTASAEDKPSYLGKWSNGRGETLVLTAKTIRFADDKALSYRDVTRATDGDLFYLQITAAGEANGFGGKFLALYCEGEQMRMVGFASHADLLHDVNIQSDVTWFKDGVDD